MNHIKFEWDNSYDVYSAAAITEVMRPDIKGTCEDDGYHFRSEGDLQPLMNVINEYGMDFTVLEISPGFTLTAIKEVN